MAEEKNNEEVRKQPERRRVVYLIPNFFTALALLAGFYAIVKSIEGDLVVACWSIVIASILDMLDGRIARLINAQSEFGAQFDSLADVVSFGIAPMVLIHQWGLHDLGRVGFAVAFFYCASSAVRLARFNTFQGKSDPRFFSGLPTPVAGVTVAMLALIMSNEPNLGQVILMVILVAVLAATMVSDFRYYSFKDIDFRARVNSASMQLVALGVLALATLLILEFGSASVLIICLLYFLSGYILSSRYLIRKLRIFAINENIGEKFSFVLNYFNNTEVEKRKQRHRKDD